MGVLLCWRMVHVRLELACRTPKTPTTSLACNTTSTRSTRWLHRSTACVCLPSQQQSRRDTPCALLLAGWLYVSLWRRPLVATSCCCSLLVSTVGRCTGRLPLAAPCPCCYCLGHTLYSCSCAKVGGRSPLRTGEAGAWLPVGGCCPGASWCEVGGVSGGWRGANAWLTLLLHLLWHHR